MLRPTLSSQVGMEEYKRLEVLLDQRRFDEALIRLRVILEGEIGDYTRARCHDRANWVLIEGLRRPCPEAVLHGQEAVTLFTALGQQPERCVALVRLAKAHEFLAEWQESEVRLREALDIVREDPAAMQYGDIIIRINLGVMQYSTGRLQEALATYENAETFCKDEETEFLRHEIWRKRAIVLTDMGRIQEATHWLDKVNEALVIAKMPSLWAKHLLRIARARLEVARGRWTEARPYIINTLALAREHLDFPGMAECSCLLALIEHGEGDPNAWRRARQAINYAIASGRRNVFNEVRHRLKPLLLAEEGV